MKESHDFLVPDYYPRFACKMGDCRHPCCEGWPVSISMKNYFTLLGVDCSAPLRRKLDVSMRLCPYPTSDEYARLEPDWSGHCPLHRPDGLCAVHAELGEDVLPDVCRLYPRGVRTEEGYELSCANSCEGTLEQFLGRRAPLSFITHRVTVDVPEQAPRASFFETLDRGQAIRLSLIRVMQDRRFPIPARLTRLGRVLETIDPLLRHGDAAGIDALLSDSFEALLRDVPAPAAPASGEEAHALLADGLRVAEEMAALFDSRSDSIRAWGEAALDYFGASGGAPGDPPLSRYERAREAFDAAFPDADRFVEHMLVNHMFFMIFPFEDRPMTLLDECIALCAVYALLRFLYLGTIGASLADGRETSPDESAVRLIDVSAAVFRLVEHTGFEHLAARLLHRLGVTGQGMVDLISL